MIELQKNLPFFILVFVLVFLIVLVAAFLYTQFFVEKRRITIINDDGERIEVNVEIAADPIKHSRGLMFRKHLEEDGGMLFIFEKPGRYGFWMVNTTIPLDAIFFDDRRDVVDIITMEPCASLVEQCKIYTPISDARYVLEVNKGFAAKNKIGKKSKFIFEG
ncbi:MAG: DUF192 domain-containing protein [Candidatus Bilamarchaeaceae archaeon]